MEPTAVMKTQRGFSLFVTIMILVVIGVATVAMIRVINSGTKASGNIAFRQASLHVADAGVSAAQTWINAIANGNNPMVLGADSAGYYATVGYDAAGKETFDPKKFDWANNARTYNDPNTAGKFPGGYQVYYVIHRLSRPTDIALAAADGGDCAVPLNACAKPPNASDPGGSSQSGSSKGPKQIPPALVYYRVTVKVTGPMRNTSYVQAYMY